MTPSYHEAKDRYNFEEAWYDLDDVRRYAGDDQGFMEAYARVLVKLPPKVRRFALDRCLVVSIGRSAGGITWPMRIVDKRSTRWLIVCDENKPELADGIAHEIAHAWRGDDRLSPDVDPDCERGADDLAAEWGFKRSY